MDNYSSKQLKEEELILENHVIRSLRKVIYNYDEDMFEELYFSLVEILELLKCHILLNIFKNNYADLFPKIESVEKVEVTKSRLATIITPWHPNKNNIKKEEMIENILSKLKNKEIGCYSYVDNKAHLYKLIINSQKNYLYVGQFDRYCELIIPYRTFKDLQKGTVMK